jgi:hypothetical protein
MKKFIPIGVVAVLGVVTPFLLAQWDRGRSRERARDISGTWYLHGDLNAVCEIRQYGPDGRRALFINEHGSRAWGEVRGDRVWIPDWEDGFGNRRLEGRIRGDRIVWPDGNYWSREPERGRYR